MTLKFRRHADACALAWMAALAVIAGPLPACGGGDSGSGLDPSTFAGMHKLQLTEDCEKTVQCKAQRGETLREDDPIGHCVQDTADILNKSEEKQDAFVADYSRCRGFPVCDYVNCVQAGGMSYGDTQRDKISQVCAAETECNLVNGTMGDGIELCQEKQVNELNRYVPMQQARWESSFAACKNQSGCGYVDCYDAAFLGATGSAGTGA